MKTSQIVVTTVLTTLAVLILTGVAIFSMSPSVALASQVAAGEFDPTEHCDHFNARHVNLVEAHISAGLDLTDAQVDALQPAMAVLEAWRADMVAECEVMNLDTMDGGLSALEAALGRAEQAIAEIRPALNDFQATLTPEQQAEVTAMLEHRHHRGRDGHRRHGWH